MLINKTAQDELNNSPASLQSPHFLGYFISNVP